MTSVLLITFLSQARVFLAMARDQLLPAGVFGAVHEKFRTPHLSTLLTGGIIMVVAAFTPILVLEEMVNIGTLFAFVVVCAAVLILRIKNPQARAVAWEFARKRARDLRAKNPNEYAEIYGALDPEEISPPFRCPLVYLVAPLGILVNLTMMLFLPGDTWLRLVVWLVLGLVIYFSYGMWRSTLGQEMRGLIPDHAPQAGRPTPGPTPPDHRPEG
jgi:APA family basic amino acid/polyamine antiporter